MANKPKPKFEGAKFVTYSLTDKEKKELKSTSMTADEFDSMLLRLLEDGYKITFRDDSFNNCKACWIIPPNDKHANAGFILSGRGSTPLKALKQAAFIHYRIFNEEWSPHYLAARGEELDD